MKALGKIKGLAHRLAARLYHWAGSAVQWFAHKDWRKIGQNVVNFLGRVMHKLLFSWLLPERYRNISKEEIFTIIFKSDTPAGKKFDIWLLVMIVLNIMVLMADSLFGTSLWVRIGPSLTG